VKRLIEENFPHSLYLAPESAKRLLGRLADARISGCSVYDALVGATAIEHGIVLATRDQRALATYRALDVNVELVPERV
jgi:predicted nucleic acid-binding protein